MEVPTEGYSKITQIQRQKISTHIPQTYPPMRWDLCVRSQSHRQPIQELLSDPLTRRPYLQVLLQDTVPAQAFFETGADISCFNQDTLLDIWNSPIQMSNTRYSVDEKVTHFYTT
jgi:hypothetical protein